MGNLFKIVVFKFFVKIRNYLLCTFISMPFSKREFGSDFSSQWEYMPGEPLFWFPFSDACFAVFSDIFGGSDCVLTAFFLFNVPEFKKLEMIL